MEFKPFAAPESEYAPLNKGIGDAGGVTAKGLVDGINTYFKHLFGLIGDRANEVLHAIDGEARERIAELEDIIADLQQRLDKIEHAAPKKGK